MKVRNFSRHTFNQDQVEALTLVGEALGMVLKPGEHEKPFFRNAADFIEQVGEQVSCAVVPGDIMRDCWAMTPAGNERDEFTVGIPVGTIIIGWRTDQAARRRGRFAVVGVTAHQWQKAFFAANSVGENDCYGAVVLPKLVFEAKISPTIENNFSDGKEFEYGAAL